MPVLISAFQSDIALVRMLADRLIQDGGEVRCYLEEDDVVLRNVGCKLAVGALDDEFNFEAALTNVHTLIALFPSGNFASAVARAAGTARVPHTIIALGDHPEVQADFEKYCSPLCVIRAGPDVRGEDLVEALAAADDKET